MEKTITKVLAASLAITLVILLSACGGDKIPNGRYEPVDEAMAFTIQAIVIDGNNFTQVLPLGVGSTTLKFKYKDGTITFTEGGAGLNLACEYKDGALWYSGVEFKKTGK